MNLQNPLKSSTPVEREAQREKVFSILSSAVSLEKDSSQSRMLSAIVPANSLRQAVITLRDHEELRFDLLLDIIGIDYLNYPDYQGPRFAVAYVFRSLLLPGMRFQLKVLLDEESPIVDSIHDLYRIADWQEREVYDQYGVQFAGHPNLKRLLNHFEFKGHPLRKDYPATKRQWLSTNDPMLDQLEARLNQNGFQLLEPVPVNTPAVEDLIKGSRHEST